MKHDYLKDDRAQYEQQVIGPVMAAVGQPPCRQDEELRLFVEELIRTEPTLEELLQAP